MPSEEPVPPPAGPFDIDIQVFKASTVIKLGKGRPIELRLDVRNNGSVEGQGTATLIGMQNGVEVYNQSLPVTDAVGNGPGRYYFPSYTPSAAGDIVWTLTLSDDDPDNDTMMATTRVNP
jgi:hypothetical protein